MNIRLSPNSLALGALLAFTVFFVMGQAGPTTASGSWGPPKKSIVNMFDNQVNPIAAGSSLVIYSVPADRWFTVTGVSVGSGNGLYWGENHAGVIRHKGLANSDGTHLLRNTPAGGGSEIGWTFRPGSEVVLNNLSSLPAAYEYVTLIGYLSRD